MGTLDEKRPSRLWLREWALGLSGVESSLCPSPALYPKKYTSPRWGVERVIVPT